MFGLGMAPKEILSHLLNPFNLKTLELYLETWLWSPLIFPPRGNGYMRLHENIHFLTILFIFNIFRFIIIIYIITLLFQSVYISLLPLLSLPKLILSPFLPLLFGIIIYQFGYFINSSVQFRDYSTVIIIFIIVAIIIFILIYYHYYPYYYQIIIIIIIIHYHYVKYHYILLYLSLIILTLNFIIIYWF